MDKYLGTDLFRWPSAFNTFAPGLRIVMSLKTNKIIIAINKNSKKKIGIICNILVWHLILKIKIPT